MSSNHLIHNQENQTLYSSRTPSRTLWFPPMEETRHKAQLSTPKRNPETSGKEFSRPKERGKEGEKIVESISRVPRVRHGREKSDTKKQ